MAYLQKVLKAWWTFEYDPNIPVAHAWFATLFYNTVFACVLTVVFVIFIPRATFANSFVETFIVSHCIGICIHAGFEVLVRFAPRWIITKNAWRERVIRIAIPTLGGAIGWAIAFGMMRGDVIELATRHPRIMLLVFAGAFIMALVFYFISSAQTRAMRAQVRESTLVAHVKEAELRSLQAQIEPHFLFNTLANVQALIDYEPSKAKEMLDAFILHLRHSLAESRKQTTTLGNELALVESYLRILQIRMGERLRFSTDVPADLLQRSIAPLLLQPLVENAVKYGLEPKVEGGLVQIVARTSNETLVIDVIDDGVGLNAPSTAQKGSGIGIANVRERLAALYGSTAQLDLTSRAPAASGTLARISIPQMKSII
jgi:signal transduction histidine kinase